MRTKLLENTRLKQLELTPDSEMIEEDQELRALKFYTTDGSHKNLADYWKGASGIVFMQDKRHSIERHSISLIPGEATSVMTAYT
jgi:hypothetical protein